MSGLLVPGCAERCLAAIAALPPAQVRAGAWMAVVAGLSIVWLIRG